MNFLKKITLAALFTGCLLPLTGAEVGVMDSLNKVRFSETNLSIPAGGIAVDAAKNESEAFQIITRGKEGEKVSVAVGALKDSKGVSPAVTVKIRHVVDRYLENTSNFANSSGMYPEILRWADNAVLKADEAGRFWITLRVAPDSPAGIFKGNVEVTTADGVKKIPLTLTIRSFALPHLPSLRADAGIWEQFVEPVYELERGRDYFEFIREHWPLLAEYRISPRMSMQLSNAEIDGIPTLKPLPGHEDLVEAFEKAGLSYFSLPGGQFQRWKPERYQRLNNFVKQHPFLKEHGIVYFADEPWGEEGRRKLAEDLKIAKENAPDVKFMVTYYPCPELAGLVDVWNSPTTELRPNVLEDMKKERANGKSTFTYNNTIYYAVDSHPTRMRLYFWRNFCNGFTGSVFWCTTHWKMRDGSPTRLLDPTAVKSEDFAQYGVDGILFYPGEEGLMPGIMMESVRDALEDYDYLTIAQQTVKSEAGKQELEAILKEAKKMFPKTLVKTNFKHSPETFKKLRTRLAVLIEKESAK
ncbi:MAG: DUF4091 domain-containing protein [Victivallales bacterium]|nr:DUF4091 domain-containing protein [Victivallales bacterium]